MLVNKAGGVTPSVGELAGPPETRDPHFPHQRARPGLIFQDKSALLYAPNYPFGCGQPPLKWGRGHHRGVPYRPPTILYKMF